jgi:hypothetical protein
VRVALALLIAVVQVAGSWLCCCGPALWLANPTSPVAASHCGEPAVASADPAPCPHCKHSGTESKPSPSPRKHSPMPDQCPCGGMKIESVPPAVTTAEPGATHPLPAPFPLDLSPLHLAIAATGLVSELPFLPAEGRLYAHHVLRC